jgi:alpha-galactosidase
MVSARRQRRPRANAHPAVRSGSTAGRARWQTPGMAKVAIIGAGSVEFTRNILTDLCSAPELHGTLELALHDIDGERLAYAERAANQVVERLDAGYKVYANADRRDAFEGADYLVNEIQVGGYDATVRDFEIPKRYGLRQTIADTIGIGGIMRGLRTIPVMIEMGNEMASLCPEGLLLNYTNPMAMVPWGIWSGSAWPAANTVGVCHSVRDTHTFLAELAGVPEQQVEFLTAGLNHQCFVYVFRNKNTGEDLYPRIRAAVEADPDGLDGGSASRSSGGSATSPPRAQNTRANTSRGSCIFRTRWSISAARSTSTSDEATRTSRNGRR